MRRRTPAAYLAQLRGIARARGGALLSRAYVDDTTTLRFRCAAGHEWRVAPGRVKQGRWCGRCSIARSIARQKAPAIARLHRLVERRGGVVVSPEYLNSQTRLRYRCRDGHEWETVPNSILQGSWCPVCAVRIRMAHQAERKHRVYRRLRRIVKGRGGTILPPGYVAYKSWLSLRCARGHRWESPPESIESGVWCPRCKEESRMAVLRATAERWGGTCLSRGCRTTRDRLTWRCAQGHRFQKSVASIRRGGWCGVCRNPRRGDIGRMREIARERGGECRSSRYVDARTKLRWRCGNGHEWRTTPGSIVQGTWCPVCRVRGGHSLAPLSIGIMQLTAKGLGGQCLSKTYHGSKVPLRWRCARGHTWMAHPFRVRQGHWCPVCAHSALGTLTGMRALAIERGGRCLTRAWNDHRRPMMFECGRGHRFQARAAAVKTGVWCPECRGSARTWREGTARPLGA